MASNKESWEEEFERLCKDCATDTASQTNFEFYGKSFISQLLAKTREEGRQEVLQRGGNFIKYHEGVIAERSRLIKLMDEMMKEPITDFRQKEERNAVLESLKAQIDEG